MTTEAANGAAIGDGGSTSLLSINNIEVVYDHVILALKGVSLDIPKGGITALLGANGAGKSTTLKAVSNILKSERGGSPRAASPWVARPFITSRPTIWSSAAWSR